MPPPVFQIESLCLIRKVLGTDAGKDAEEALKPFAEFLNQTCIAFLVFVKGFIASYLAPSK